MKKPRYKRETPTAILKNKLALAEAALEQVTEERNRLGREHREAAAALELESKSKRDAWSHLETSRSALRHKLLQAEITAARLQGYADRVREVDAESHGPVGSTVTTTHTDHVPPRHSAPIFAEPAVDGEPFDNRPSGIIRSSTSSKHWLDL